MVTSLREAIAITQLAGSDNAAKIAAIDYLAKSRVIRSLDLLKKLSTDPDPQVAAAASKAVVNIEGYLRWVELWGTLFRGLSLGSILLIAALGLAITFGLMGVINMAHGEIIVVGAYTTYHGPEHFRSGSVSFVFRIQSKHSRLSFWGRALRKLFSLCDSDFVSRGGRGWDRSRARCHSVPLQQTAGIPSGDMGSFPRPSAAFPSDFRGQQRPGLLAELAKRKLYSERRVAGMEPAFRDRICDSDRACSSGCC